VDRLKDITQIYQFKVKVQLRKLTENYSDSTLKRKSPKTQRLPEKIEKTDKETTERGRYNLQDVMISQIKVRAKSNDVLWACAPHHL
jgi:hypothetical protein